ncbi:MAG: FmdE family protein [Eubacteriales bacterium]
MDKKLWEKCVDFHGHECPGLAMGFRAAQIAMERLGEMSPLSDEKIVCVTENDACGVDAVQVITGCTIGKGNLIYKPTGKMAFSFFCRNSGNKIRIVVKPKSGTALNREEWKKYLLEAPAEEAFLIKEPDFTVPECARLFSSEVCEECGEAAPEHMMRLQNGKKVCMDCFKEYTRGWK